MGLVLVRPAEETYGIEPDLRPIFGRDNAKKVGLTRGLAVN
jgi:hypothetical protein